MPIENPQQNPLLFEDFIENSLLETKYTPDVASLENSFQHYIFTYGSLKRNYVRHEILEHTKYIGLGQTEFDNYLLYNYKPNNTNGFPICIKDATDRFSGRIQGEVFLVPTETIYELDQIESNGLMYKREYIPIIFIHKGKYYKRFMFTYTGLDSFWKPYVLEPFPEHKKYSMNTCGYSVCTNTRNETTKVYIYNYSLLDYSKKILPRIH